MFDFKKKIKLFFFRMGYKIEKIYIQKNYNQTSPKLELLKKMTECSGILHLGAHRGSESGTYEYFGKKVIWVEANPRIFLDLEINLKKYIFQESFCQLLSDKDDILTEFNISNNDAASSSIFKFGNLSEGKKSLWADRNLKMIKTIKLNTLTLDTFLERNKINIKNYDHWVIDVQGAELLVLEGSKKNIKYCKSILIEVSKGDIYKNGGQWDDVKIFLEKNNFKPLWKIENKHQDVLFVKI